MEHTCWADFSGALPEPLWSPKLPNTMRIPTLRYSFVLQPSLLQSIRVYLRPEKTAPDISAYYWALSEPRRSDRVSPEPFRSPSGAVNFQMLCAIGLHNCMLYAVRMLNASGFTCARQT